MNPTREQQPCKGAPWYSGEVLAMDAGTGTMLSFEQARQRGADRSRLLASLKKKVTGPDYFPFAGVRAVFPERPASPWPTPVSFDESEFIEHIAAALQRESTAEGTACFALSGGIDSAVLAAINAKVLHRKTRCFTASTRHGNDLKYAEAAAAEIGAELDVVPIDMEDPAILEWHRKLSANSDCVVPFLGNAIAFPLVVAAARKAGFDTLFDGTGADQIFAGTYWTHGSAWYAYASAHAPERAQEYLAYALANNLTSHKHIAKYAGHAAAQDFPAYLAGQICRGALLGWASQHRATARATGVRLAMPYMQEPIARYAFQDPLVHFRGGSNKPQLRAILRKLGVESIAGRVDNQGLRISNEHIYRAHRAHIKDVIARSDLPGFFDRLGLALARGPSKALRYYSVAVFREANPSGQPASLSQAP